MADGTLKQTFLDAVRLTPDGIDAFLLTPLPPAPSVSAPGDVDAAIIASGVLSKYLLDVFKAFEGLTPIELLLRIGQHNSVLESAMIAGLEYIEGADSESNGITITEPATGKTYSPGEMRFTVTVKNGVCVNMTLTLDAGNAMSMKENGGTWQQYVDVGIGEHSATAQGTFEDGTTQQASANFTVYDTENPPEPPPPEPPDPIEPPQGTDNSALTRAREKAFTAYRQFIGDIRDQSDLNPFESIKELLGYLNAFKSAALAFTTICPDDAFTTPKKADIARYLSEMEPGNLPTANVLVTKSSATMDLINALYVYVVK